MAQIKKITQSNPLSAFTQVAPDGGAAFRAFADVADNLYRYLEPAMRSQATREGTAAGQAMARGGRGTTGAPAASGGVTGPAV